MLTAEIQGHKIEAKSMSELRRKIIQVEDKIYGTNNIEKEVVTVEDLNNGNYSVSCVPEEPLSEEDKALIEACKRN